MTLACILLLWQKKTQKHCNVFLRRYVTDDQWTINIIVLEVLLILWEKRENIPQIKEPVKWMFGIAKKKALQYLQNKRLHIFYY
jgi:DNA-directed RNA polymerase specialized sigma24 family protein